MKKFLSFLFIIFSVCLLVGCDLGNLGIENKEDEKIIVEFESNGGSEIQKIEIKVDEIGSFTMPTDPVKEGYIFKGWYIDADLTEAFDNLSKDLENIKLYAKWEKEEVPGDYSSISYEGKYSIDVNVSDPVTLEEQKVALDLEYNCYYDLTSMTSLDTFLGGMNIKVNSLEELGIASLLAINVNIQDGNLYIELPEELFADMPDVVNKVYIDLQTIYDKMMEYSDEVVTQIPDDFLPENFESMTVEEILDFVIDTVFEELINSNEISEEDAKVIEELFKGLLEIFKGFIPKPVVTPISTTYQITDEQFNNFVDELAKYITTNIDKIYFFAMVESAREEYFEMDGCIYYMYEPRWIDADGVEHHYSEDLEVLEYGGLLGDRYYEPFMAGNVIYDTQDNWKSYLVEYVFDDDGMLFIVLDDFRYLDEQYVIHSSEEFFANATLIKQVLYPVDGTEYFYCYMNENYYDFNYQLVDREVAIDAIAKAEQEEAVEMINQYVALLKEAVTINEMKLEYNSFANIISELKEVIDVKIELPEDFGGVSASIKLNFEHQANFSSDRLSKEDFSLYIDCTTDLIMLIEMEMNPDIEFNPDDYYDPGMPSI